MHISMEATPQITEFIQLVLNKLKIDYNIFKCLKFLLIKILYYKVLQMFKVLYHYQSCGHLSLILIFQLQNI